MLPYSWDTREEFVNRAEDLARMEQWWDGRDRNALALYGRRRIGKSWLFRAFADGKPAVMLVAERRTEGAQLSRFASRLAPWLGGVRPDLPDIPTLFEVLYSLAEREKTLVVIDELGYLLPTRRREQRELLTAIQAVMEERREASRLKLILCGSHITQMRTLLAEDSPLRGRLTPLPVVPLRFRDAQAFAGAGASPRERVERYAVAGGMSLYLSELARKPGKLADRICELVLDPRGPLFNDPRDVLEEEFRQPGVYFSLLEELAAGEAAIGDLAAALGKGTTDLSDYLKTLQDMQLIERVAPVTAGKRFRDHRYRIADGFLRFWFRFVFPFQDDLRTGLRSKDHYAGEVEPVLADHVASAFEALCREWTRLTHGRLVSRVGTWWGPALNELRRSGERMSEQIDIVGLGRSVISIIGECKWTNRRLTAKVLEDIERYKIPALRQAGLKIASGGPRILLFSRSGFKRSLVDIARERDDVELIGLDQLVGDLLAVGARLAVDLGAREA